MNENDITTLVKRIFLLWAAILFLTNIVLKVVFFRFALDFLLNYTFVTNVIATIIYLTIFIVLIISLKPLKDCHTAKNLVLTWGFILFIVLLQNMYVIMTVPTVAPAAILTGMPMEVIGAAIGTFVSFLLTGKRVFMNLTILNVTIMFCAVCGMLFPFESIFRVTTNLAMQYSGLLILNLSVIGLLLKQGDSFIN
ncbi:MAG: hypothetical protein K0S22_1798 [Oscillospiraceae bacterium]|nr:hypothetical protein [Oscillospiraceae bacterium]